MMEALFSRVLTASVLFLVPAALLLPPVRRRIAPRVRGAMSLLLCARLLLPLWPRVPLFCVSTVYVPDPARPAAFSASEAAAAVWCAGAAVFLLYRLGAALLFCRAARRWSRAPVFPGTAALWNRLREACGVRRDIPLRVCPKVPGPMLIGLLRPAVLIPDEADITEAALRHELWHHRRGDLWRKLLFGVAQAAHWWNPFVHWMARRAQDDLELCCDEAALRGCGQEERLQYGEALLREIRRRSGRRDWFAAGFGGGPAARERLTRLLRPQRQRGRAFAALLAALLALTAGLFGVSAYTLRPVDAHSSAGEVARLESHLERFLTGYTPFCEARVALEPQRPRAVVELRCIDGWDVDSQAENVGQIVSSLIENCSPGDVSVTGGPARQRS